MSLFDVKFDGDATKHIILAVKRFFKHQPRWLVATLAFSVIFGAGYYLYTYKNDKQEILELQEHVSELNKIINTFVDETYYKNNLMYFVEDIKILEYVLEENYQERMYEIDLLINCAQTHFPGDPMIKDLMAMKNRMQVNYSILKQHHEIVIKNIDRLLDEEHVKND